METNFKNNLAPAVIELNRMNEELQAENSQLKKDLEHARSYKHTIKMRNRNLQTETERLKDELDKRQQELMGECELRITIENIRDNLETENEQLKRELKQTEAQDQVVIDELRNENAKLKCLALHAMSEYCFAQGTIIHTQLEFTEQPFEEDRKMIHKVNFRDRWGEHFAEAYRKAKKELMEVK